MEEYQRGGLAAGARLPYRATSLTPHRSSPSKLEAFLRHILEIPSHEVILPPQPTGSTDTRGYPLLQIRNAARRRDPGRGRFVDRPSKATPLQRTTTGR